METGEVSLHQLKVFRFVEGSESWVSNREISDGTGICRRTVSSHTLKLVKLGLFDQAEVFPAHRYRLSKMAAKRNVGYWNRIMAAAEVFQV